jgi:hypothetical protein
MSAHAGSRSRVASMGGLCDAATLHALCLPGGTFPLLLSSTTHNARDNKLRGRELNPGLPRDRWKYLSLYYHGSDNIENGACRHACDVSWTNEVELSSSSRLAPPLDPDIFLLGSLRRSAPASSQTSTSSPKEGLVPQEELDVRCGG